MSPPRACPCIYICAPFEDGPGLLARTIPAMISAGIIPLASWVDDALNGKSDKTLNIAAAQAALVVNDFELASSDGVLVIARDGTGGEMFCEAGKALALSIPVFWVGRRVLSTWRQGVTICDSVDDAIDTIKAVIKP